MDVPHTSQDWYAWRDAEIVKLRGQGTPVSEIAEKFDITDKRVYQILEEQDWKKTRVSGGT